MSAIIKLFLDICLFRKGPQDAPASQLLLVLTLIFYAVVGLILFGTEVGFLGAVFQILIEGGMLLGFLYLTLTSAGFKTRLLQTSIAMLGTDALISAMAVPLVAFAMNSQEGQFAYIILLMLTLWHVSVVAHILRHALSRTYSYGLVLAIGYFIGTYYLMTMLVGPPS